MKSLIEQSKEKSTNFFTMIDGVQVPNYASVYAKKQIGEKKYIWYIQRALEGYGYRKHYICCEVINNHLETRRAKLYDNVADFESAIKRIEKQVN